MGVFGKELSFLPPVIDGNTLIVANLLSIESYDLVSGSLNWAAKLEKDNQTARMWSGFSYDEKNKLIYVVTSNAGWFLDEDMKEGGYFNSLVAVDAKSGKVKWAIKEIKHDLWDLDMVGPPMLADIKLNGKMVPIILAVSKSGNTIFANRRTGELIYESDYKILTDKNEYPPVTQLDIKKPEPFSGNYFDLNKDITSISQQKRDSVLHKTRKAKQGDLLPVSPDYDVVMYGLHGGAEWSGGSFDPYKSILVVPSNKYPWILRAGYVDKNPLATVEFSKKNSVYLTKCSACHGENLRGWFQNELNGDIYVPSLINITSKINKDKFIDVANFKSSHNFSQYIKGEYVAPFHLGYLKDKSEALAKRIEKYCKKFGLSDENTTSIKKFAMDRYQPEPDIKEINFNAVVNIEKVTSSDLSNIYKMFSEVDLDIKKNNRLALEPIHQLLLDKDGMFGSEPPWGNLTAIDLNTGLIKWQRPFGEYLDPISKKLIRGDMNFGGIITTKNGLVFATGTRDSFARAYDINNGRELWKSLLPAAGSSPPMTYSANGCQYVLFTATGGQFYGYTKSDTTISYKLKDCPKK
jgi:quinoprotein glucose dehydrogenase